jgi:16S rRNA (uracil1498-N3)-methyltransferase
VNRLLFEAGEIAETGETGELALVGRRAQHLIDVLGVEPGAELRAGVIGGAIGIATVVAVTPLREVIVRFAPTGPAPPPLAIDLIVAVPRPKVLSRLIQIAAAFGVGAIHLTRSWRVDKAYLASPRLAPEALALDARLGAEQGTSTHLPAIVRHDRFMAMIDAVPVPPRRIVAHPVNAVPVEAVVAAGDPAPLIAAIGPEGGWIEREIATFVERGYAVVEIARPILRVEAAVAALLGQLALLGRLTRSP